MSEKPNWEEVANLEFDPNHEYAGDEIVFVGDGVHGLKIVVAKDKAGQHYPLHCTDSGWCDGEPTIRNKPKRVKLQECWVVYTPDGQYRITVFSEEAAEWAAGNCGIVRHIPAETV